MFESESILSVQYSDHMHVTQVTAISDNLILKASGDVVLLQEAEDKAHPLFVDMLIETFVERENGQSIIPGSLVVQRDCFKAVAQESGRVSLSVPQAKAFEAFHNLDLFHTPSLMHREADRLFCYWLRKPLRAAALAGLFMPSGRFSVAHPDGSGLQSDSGWLDEALSH